MGHFAFIDAQNVYLSVRGQGWRIDWARFRTYLTDKYHIEKAFLFIGYIDSNKWLYAVLEEAGFICIFKQVSMHTDGVVKGNIDAELVLHTMVHISSFEKALIITGDGDFACLIEYLRINHKLHGVLIPNKFRYSALLKQSAKNQIAFMNDLKKKIGRT